MADMDIKQGTICCTPTIVLVVCCNEKTFMGIN